MVSFDDEPHRHQALAKLREHLESLATPHVSPQPLSAAQVRALTDCREQVDLLDRLLDEIDHHMRGALTVVRGRTQLLRRSALAAPARDLRLITGLDEIDAAVERVVGELERMLKLQLEAEHDAG